MARSETIIGTPFNLKLFSIGSKPTTGIFDWSFKLNVKRRILPSVGAALLKDAAETSPSSLSAKRNPHSERIESGFVFSIPFESAPESDVEFALLPTAG